MNNQSYVYMYKTLQKAEHYMIFDVDFGVNYIVRMFIITIYFYVRGPFSLFYMNRCVYCKVPYKIGKKTFRPINTRIVVKQLPWEYFEGFIRRIWGGTLANRS